MSRTTIALILTLSAITSSPALTQEKTEPLETELTEEVEVRYVILDTLVLDSKGNSVPDLVPEDFELYLDRRPHPVATVDINCPEGAFEEPKAVADGQKRDAPMAPEVPRRVVLVLDYRRLPHTLRAEVIDRLEAMVRDNHVQSEELMLVAVTRRLRVEQRFTDDPEKILTALERMNNDPSLWQVHPSPYYDEFDLFNALSDLIRMLSRYEGRKAIVLFSEMQSKVPDRPFGRPLSRTPAAFDYDRMFEDVATAAMDARVPVYTIHARGLSGAPSSERLSRLAVETGGRFTRNTNDLSLAYVRAQRDLACRYAVGFYDTKTEENRLHDVNLKVRRPGVRVIHPRIYRFGSDDVARESLADTVYTAPVEFGSETVSGALIPIRPISAKQWEAAVVLRFPVVIPESGTNLVAFGAKLDDDALRGVHAFDSSLTVEGYGREGEQLMTVIEPAYVAPGEYELSIAVNDPEVEEPHASVGSAHLPELPKRGLVVVPPVLLREAVEERAVSWVEDFEIASGGTLEPLMPDEPIGAIPLRAITSMCWLPGSRGELAVEVERRLQGLKIAVDELVLGEADRGGCRQIIDRLPNHKAKPGTYTFEVIVRSNGLEDEIRRDSSFTIAW
jgi:VWFA-related protein